MENRRNAGQTSIRFSVTKPAITQIKFWVRKDEHRPKQILHAKIYMLLSYMQISGCKYTIKKRHTSINIEKYL